jgi:hypothetical protein
MDGRNQGVWGFEDNNWIAAFAELAAKDGAEQSDIIPEISGDDVSVSD